MVCREICKRYKYKKYNFGDEYYANGASRCMGSCDIWINWSGLYCPCCGYRLRKKTRHENQKIKRKMQRDARRMNLAQS